MLKIGLFMGLCWISWSCSSAVYIPGERKQDASNGNEKPQSTDQNNSADNKAQITADETSVTPPTMITGAFLCSAESLPKNSLRLTCALSDQYADNESNSPPTWRVLDTQGNPADVTYESETTAVVVVVIIPKTHSAIRIEALLSNGDVLTSDDIDPENLAIVPSGATTEASTENNVISTDRNSDLGDAIAGADNPSPDNPSPDNPSPNNPSPDSLSPDNPPPDTPPTQMLNSFLYDWQVDGANLAQDWFDTDVDNQVAFADHFQIIELDGEPVLALRPIIGHRENIHSHLNTKTSNEWQNYEYSGKMMRTRGATDIGITFYSDFPNSSHSYRIRSLGEGLEISSYSDIQGSSNPDFNCDDNSLTFDEGLTVNTWQKFRVQIQTRQDHIQFRAKVWDEATTEPDWQKVCRDKSSNRRAFGTVGVWAKERPSANPHGLWGDLRVTQLQD